jgi:hypothetical protein
MSRAAHSKRKFWQFHLLTLMAWVTLAPLAIALNCQCIVLHTKMQSYYSYGWPISLYAFRISEGGRLYPCGAWLIISIDTLAFIVVAFLIPFLFEWLIRREARKT